MSNDKVVERPEFVTERHLIYLDALRSSAITNMFGATPYLQKDFPELTKSQARKVLGYWMETFSERRSEDG